MKLYLVRHGETDANKQRYVPGKSEELNDAGMSQAQVLVQRFSDITIDSIVTSDYIRAKQTAQPIADSKSITIETSPDFGEFFEPSSLSNLAYSDAKVVSYRTQRDGMHDTNPDWKFEDGETFADFAVRIERSKTLLENRDEKSLLVISHAFFIKAFVTALIRQTYTPSSDWLQAMMMTKTTNTGISVFTVEGDKWKIETINDELHFAE